MHGTRKKRGLAYVSEVKKILLSRGFEVEGPAFRRVWFPDKSGKMKIKVAHVDFFGLFDLISYRPEAGYEFHQVSILPNKSKKEKAILRRGHRGFLWLRTKQNRNVIYRIFRIEKETEEIETVLLKMFEKENINKENK